MVAEPIIDVSELSPGQRLARILGHLARRVRGAFARRRPGDWRRLAAHGRKWVVADHARAGLWAPVFFGAGAAWYFGLLDEPAATLLRLWAAGAVLLALIAHAGVDALVDRRGPFPDLVLDATRSTRAFFAALALFAAGASLADWRTDHVAAPILKRELSVREVTGRLVVVEERVQGRRLTIAPSNIRGLDPEETPALVRVTWRGARFDARAGDRVTLRAGLSPPPPPAAPGAFDFARRLYFQRIGAVGFAVSQPLKDAATHPAGAAQEKSARDALAARVEDLRVRLTARIVEKAPGEGGAIVAALVTGKRGAISRDAEAALRDAGLAHLLAISGLHMGLAAGLIFFAVRAALAAAPAIALRFPIKKWAALAGLFSSTAYLILSGAGWSARRAFVMTSIVFLAILVDRRAFSLRNVALAAAIVLVMTPEAVVDPGFQMSFAAAAALIAFYEWARPRFARGRDISLPGQVGRYGAAIAVTDTVAASATAPFGLYHFGRAAVYSLPANIAATPVMGFLIMPAAIVGLFLTPLGVDGPAWRASAAGVDMVLGVARAVSDAPGAVATTPQWPPIALGLAAAGGLALCLLTTPLRAAGVALLAAGFIVAAAAPSPVAFFSHDGVNVGVVAQAAPDGSSPPLLALYDGRKTRFAARVWQEAAGVDPARARPSSLRALGDGCDAAGCVADTPAGLIAVSADPLALHEDCARADIVFALYPAPVRSHEFCAARLIDRRDAWRRGAHAVHIDRKGGVQIVSAADRRGRRPWTGDMASSDMRTGKPSDN